ncbi:ketopantoate reductase [Aspergillus filifer]
MSVPLPRIHVLSLGSIGTFTAHGLAANPNGPAVTLLLHRESLYNEFLRNNRQISLRTLAGTTVRHGGYSAELFRDGKWQTPSSSSSSSSSPHSVSTASRADNDITDHLIVTVIATQTVPVLRPLTARLKPSSTILFLQNGCGMLDEVSAHLFPDPPTRPHYLVGVISHGVTLIPRRLMPRVPVRHLSRWARCPRRMPPTRTE